MKITRRVQRVAAVLLVVFLLTTVWAAYYLYEETHPSASPAPRSLATYHEAATNQFVASLRPSYLYNNSTEIAGGNVTLFTSVTKWINVTMLYDVLVNRSAEITVHETFEAVLSTPVWSKTLAVSSNGSSVPSGHLLTLETHYAANVTHLVTLAKQIDNQIGYLGSIVTLSLRPEMSGIVGAGGVAQSFSSTPALNLSIAGPLISPHGLTYSVNGSVFPPPATAATAPGVSAAPYLAVGLSTGGLAGSAYVVARPRPKEFPPLDQVIAPYEELIADTAATPKGEVTVPVDTFPDLVKIADTLGKPILRPNGVEPGRTAFLVLDGGIAYAYWYPGSGAPGPSGPRPKGSLSLPRAPTPGPSPSVLVQRLQTETARLRGLVIDPRVDREVRWRVRRAITLVRAHDQRGAEREVDEISRLIDQAELRASGPFARRPPDS